MRRSGPGQGAVSRGQEHLLPRPTGNRLSGELYSPLCLGRLAANGNRALSQCHLWHSQLEGKSRKQLRRPSRQEALVEDLRLSPFDFAVLQHVSHREELSAHGELPG